MHCVHSDSILPQSAHIVDSVFTLLIKSGLDRSNVQCERKRTLSGSELVTFRAKHVVRYIRFVFRARKKWPADLSCHSNKTTLTRGAVWAIKNCSECERSQTVPQDPFLWSGLTKTTFKVSENGVKQNPVSDRDWGWTQCETSMPTVCKTVPHYGQKCEHSTFA